MEGSALSENDEGIMRALAIEDTLPMFESARTRFSQLLRSIPKGAVPVPHLSWTVGETGAHVLSCLRGYRDMALGGPPMWPDLANGDIHNARALAEVPERDPFDLADAIETAAGALMQVWRESAGGDVPWHAGLMVPTASVVAILSNDLLIHGWDIAVAVRRPWTIGESDSILAIRAYEDVLPAFVHPSTAAGFSATYMLRLRGGPDIALAFSGPRLTVTEENGRADVRISARPSAWNLLSVGRIGRVKPFLKGEILVYGRNPWLAQRIPTLFYKT